MVKRARRLRHGDKNKIAKLVEDKFLALVRMGLDDHKSQERVNKARSQHPGLPRDALSNILIKRAMRKTTVDGVVSGGAITACEATLPVTGGGSTVPVVAAITAIVLGDVTYTTSVQMKLITDIAHLYECPFSKENEEDVWFIFKYALGLKGTEKLGGYSRILFSDTARKQFRKLLRTGIRRAVQDRVAKTTGRRVARYLGEKYVLRIIPIVNAALGGYFNRRITKSVGKWTKIKAKIRSATFKQIDTLNTIGPNEKHWVLPLIFAVGTANDKLTDNVISLYVQSQGRLELTQEQVKTVEEIVDDERLDDRMKIEFSSIHDQDVKIALLDVAVTAAAVNIRTTEKHEEYLDRIAGWLNLKFENQSLKDKVKWLKR